MEGEQGTVRDAVAGEQERVAGRQDCAARVSPSEGAQGVLVAPCGHEGEVATFLGGAGGEAGNHARLGPGEFDGVGAETSCQLVGDAGAWDGVEDAKDGRRLLDAVILWGWHGVVEGHLGRSGPG